jgi:hypothetical protein
MALQVLCKNFPHVLNGKYSMIISKIVNVHSKSTRSCYYLSDINGGLVVHRGVYKITKNNKYEIVGDFEAEDLIYLGKVLTCKSLLLFFDKIKIDTICVKCVNCEKIQILYDATGHLNIGQKWLGIYKYWVNIKKQAELEGHPDNLIINLD